MVVLGIVQERPGKKELITALEKQGFSTRTVKAFKKVSREKFVSKNLTEYAYEDRALPLEENSTISQPSTIAFMLDLLELKHGQKILNIGSGIGYTLALLLEITNGDVYGIELSHNLVLKSRRLLSSERNLVIIESDGSKGMPMYAPYDRIIVDASASSLPIDLYEQLKEGGIIVIPITGSLYQIKKENGKMVIRQFPGFSFVPLQQREES